MGAFAAAAALREAEAAIVSRLRATMAGSSKTAPAGGMGSPAGRCEAENAVFVHGRLFEYEHVEFWLRQCTWSAMCMEWHSATNPTWQTRVRTLPPLLHIPALTTSPHMQPQKRQPTRRH